jgi:hypothetical protein
MATALVALFTWAVLVANVGFASGTGIECGWQPMRDGSAAYECVVQVDAALLNSLERGDSIPLTVDVPEHIRPISRIRVVVGDGAVPREVLAANLKAWPQAEKKPRDRVVETQFTTSNDAERYYNNNQQATNGAVVPLNGNGAAADAQDAFARQLQNGGQAVRTAVGQVTQDVLPPDPGRSVANAVDRAGQQLGNNLRSASDSVSNDIRQLFGNEPAADGDSILPPGGQNAPSFENPQAQPILPGDANTAGSNRRRLDQPVTPSQGANWQSSAPPTNSTNGNNTINPPNNFDARWAAETRTPAQSASGSNPLAGPPGDHYGAAPPFAGNSAVLPQNNSAATNQGDRYGNVGQNPTGGLFAADNRSGATTGAQPANSGPSFPPFTPTGNEQSPITPTPMTSSSTPEIRRGMLNQPANADIQGANGLPIGQQPISQTMNPGTQVAAQSPPPQAASGGSDFGWNMKPQSQQTAAPQMAGPAGTASNSVFPLLLSWVLLSGSGAGNLYLFWSYLDVRNKYRDLVDDAARRISGRRVRD